MDKSQELREVLLRYLDADLERIIFSNPRTRESYLKLTVRPLLLRGALAFQTEEFTEKQAFQKNQNAEKTAEYLLGELENRYRNAEIASLHGIVNILISKKGTVTVKEKKVGVKRAENRTVSVAAGDVQKAGKQMPAKSHADVKENSLEKSGQSQSSHENGKMQRSAKIQGNGKLQSNAKQQKNAGTGLSAGMDAAAFSERLASLSHNRTKKYVLQEGVPVPFLVDLGVMTAEGKVVKSRYDKFRQINRFLEFIEDVLPELPKDREVTILDFGCGKSYLTFAIYYYLHELKGYDIRIIGLDLKTDVIYACNQLAKKYGYRKLKFMEGNIADYTGFDEVDMVVTLHACDTATDFALAKAVGWKAKVILSVPCCQHEVNRQIANETLAPLFSYGLIKERMAALVTDAMRAEYLKREGYDTQILEFIDMEHTPKNILIRAIYTGNKGKNTEAIRTCEEMLHIDPMLGRLLDQQNEEGEKGV